MAYELPELPYAYDALEPHYDAEMLELHHDKHHAKYVEGLNATLEKLEKARAKEDFGALVGLEQTLAFNLSGHVLHSLLWKNLGPDGGGEPSGALAQAIGQSFGSFASFRMQMTKAVSTVQGSGWGALAYEPLGKRLVVEQIYDHQHNSGAGSLPLLVIDAWEHAYYLQFRNRKAEYAEEIWNVVNWQDVQERYERVSKYTLV